MINDIYINEVKNVSVQVIGIAQVEAKVQENG